MKDFLLRMRIQQMDGDGSPFKMENMKTDQKSLLYKTLLSQREINTKLDEKVDELAHQKHIVNYLERKKEDLQDQINRKSNELISLRRKNNEDENTIERLRAQIEKQQSSALLRENNELREKMAQLQSVEAVNDLREKARVVECDLMEKQERLVQMKEEIVRERREVMELIENKDREFQDREDNFFSRLRQLYDAMQEKEDKISEERELIDQKRQNLDDLRVGIMNDRVLLNNEREAFEKMRLTLEEEGFTNDSLQKSLIHLQTTMSQLKQDRDRLENENQKISSESSSKWQKERDSLLSTIERLKTELDDSKREQEKKPRITELKNWTDIHNDRVSQPQIPLLKKKSDNNISILQSNSRQSSPRSIQPSKSWITENTVKPPKDDEINMSNQPLSSIQLIQLCSSLSENSTVKRLNLSNVGIMNNNLGHLISMLKKNRSIRELILTGNTITDWKTFSIGIKNNHSLWKLEFGEHNDQDLSLLQERVSRNKY